MSEQERNGRDAQPSAREKMADEVGAREKRKMHARRTEDQSTWFGLGMMGTVGWTVVVPTLLGVALGAWLDAAWPGPFPWTLALLVGGLLLGCVTAWLWVAQEQRTMEREKEERDGA